MQSGTVVIEQWTAPLALFTSTNSPGVWKPLPERRDDCNQDPHYSFMNMLFPKRHKTDGSCVCQTMDYGVSFGRQHTEVSFWRIIGSFSLERAPPTDFPMLDLLDWYFWF